jgi:hypothetical protein
VDTAASQRPEHPSADVVGFMSRRMADLYGRAAAFLSELPPDQLPRDLLDGCVDMMQSMLQLGSDIAEHARHYGFDGPNPFLENPDVWPRRPE